MASEVSTFPMPWLPPVILTWPATQNFASGVDVPMPTSPLLSIQTVPFLPLSHSALALPRAVTFKHPLGLLGRGRGVDSARNIYPGVENSPGYPSITRHVQPVIWLWGPDTYIAVARKDHAASRTRILVSDATPRSRSRGAGTECLQASESRSTSTK